MVSSWSYILIAIPITVFIYLPYVSFLDFSPLEYLILLGVLYIIMAFDLSVDTVFRKSFIVMLFVGVGKPGRTIIYLFMAITLITGPIYDIYMNILEIVEDNLVRRRPEDLLKMSEFKLKLYNILESHIENHLLHSVKPMCKVADDWITYNNRKTSDFCGSLLTRTYQIVTKTNSYEELMNGFFSLGTFYMVQRFVVIQLFIISTVYLAKVSKRYREDMYFKNIAITSTLSVLDSQKRELTVDIDSSDEEEIMGQDNDEEEVKERRVFTRTLPLTTLERREYILVNRFKYLRKEMALMLMHLSKFAWIGCLCWFIFYFDFVIVYFHIEDNPNSTASITLEKWIRLCIVAIYTLIAFLFVVLEPIAARLHHRLLEVFYPHVAERRAKILMLVIKLQRKSFIKINRLNIYLRFNKVGNFWTALRSFVEDSSLADCLGRPSGLFCSICEKEAKIPKNAQRCSTYSCPCVYCNECYEQIRHICLNCNKKYDETMVVHIHPNTEGNSPN